VSSADCLQTANTNKGSLPPSLAHLCVLMSTDMSRYFSLELQKKNNSNANSLVLVLYRRVNQLKRQMCEIRLPVDRGK